ncbi:hypothetical protein B1526_0623 [Bifidobacterium criceti]|uniref:Lipoprotein n=1 Tax=Bifidobacterium criceti TaxID=1960969 RepID=A0A2A2EHQ3_9BIFI|nr:hypothetical protein B1526_0623 [Bifidobacterium criceti]
MTSKGQHPKVLALFSFMSACAAPDGALAFAKLVM